MLCGEFLETVCKTQTVYLNFINSNIAEEEKQYFSHELGAPSTFKYYSVRVISSEILRDYDKIIHSRYKDKLN